MDWEHVRDCWGTDFPTDFKEFVNRYGGGIITDQLLVLQSNDVGPADSRPDTWGTPMEEWLLDTKSPYPAWPAPGSLIMWGEDMNENAYFWTTRGSDPNQWPVVVWEGGSFNADGFIEFAPGMVQLLLVASGENPPRPFNEGFWALITDMQFLPLREQER